MLKYYRLLVDFASKAKHLLLTGRTLENYNRSPENELFEIFTLSLAILGVY